jgi:hypothetical protein
MPMTATDRNASMSARMEEMVAEVSSGPPDVADAPGPEAAAASEGVPSVESAAPADAAPEKTETGALPLTEEDRVRAKHHEILDAKLAAALAEARDKAEARRLSKKAKAEREAAKAEREAAAAEKAKWDALKTGKFREGITALGRDPLEVFREMSAEAIAASDPEAQAKKAAAEKEAAIQAKLDAAEKWIADQEAAKKTAWEKHQEQQVLTKLVDHYNHAVEDPKYLDMRADIDDRDIFAQIRLWATDPKEEESFYEKAKLYGVPVEGNGFYIEEALELIRAAHAEDVRGRSERRAKLIPQNVLESSPGGPTQPPKVRTVNGTAPRKGNAETTSSTDSASERASERPARKQSVLEQLKEREAELMQWARRQ